MKHPAPVSFLSASLAVLVFASVPFAGITSNTMQLPNNEFLVGEHPWTIRLLIYHPGPVVPRRMYFSSSCLDSASPKMFVSLTSKAGTGTDTTTHCLVMKTSYNPLTGKLEPTSDYHIFTNFKEGHGIASSANGSVIAVLARRPNGTTTPGSYDKDVLVTHPDSAWMTQPGSSGKGLQDQMWLLEWLTGDIKSDPKKYIVHKAIGSWETGNNYLLFGENDNTYGFGLKTCVFGPAPDSGRHEADAFLVVNRSDYTMDRNRGWSWAVGTGHTEFNRPSYNPASKKYAVFGSTDYNDLGICGLGDISIRRDDYGDDSVFARYPSYYTLEHKGGPGTLLPMPDSGFMGVIIGEKGIADPLRPIPSCDARWPDWPPTSIGIVRFNSKMQLKGGIRWVASMDSTFLSYPQLARLDNNRFLLGYGKMYDLPSKNDWQDEKWRIPQAYYLVEIDSTGKALTDVITLDSLGWGEQDQIISLGKNRVGWAYIPKPALISSTAKPPSTSRTLCLMVYTSQNQSIRPSGSKNAGFSKHRVRLDFQKGRLVIAMTGGNNARLAITRILDAKGRVVHSTLWDAENTQPQTRTLDFGKKPSAGTYIITSVFSDGSFENTFLITP